MKGLHCSIIGRDCTNGGITSGRSGAVLAGDGVSGPFEPSYDTPLLWLEYDLEPQGAAGGYLMVASVSWLAALGLTAKAANQFSCLASDWSSKHKIVRVKAVPIIDGKPRSGMFGGNFITTSDSRWPMTGPIPVFDRFE